MLLPKFMLDMVESVVHQAPPNARRKKFMRRLIGTSRQEARVLIRYLHRCLRFDGDVCEFGVAQGATSALMANEILNTDRALWLFDSFKGLPKPSAKDIMIHDIMNLGSMDKYEGRMAYGPEKVRMRVDKVGFPPGRLKIVPGFIEESIKTEPLPRRVAFAYVDFDFYSPIRTALELLKESLSPGGMVMVDDYGWFSQGAQTAVDEFMQTNGDLFQMILPKANKYPGEHYCVLRKKR